MEHKRLPGSTRQGPGWSPSWGRASSPPKGATCSPLPMAATTPYLLRVKVRELVMAVLREDDGEHGVGAAACLIHVGGSHSPGEGVRTRW